MIEILALGGFQIVVDGQPYALSNRKAQALLGYLAFHSAQAQERSVLAELLWPELPQDTALNNLSKALGRIRRLFGQGESGLQALIATRQTVQLAGSTDWRFDVCQFNAQVQEAGATPDAASCAALLEQAVALYRGELLTGMSLAGCQTFEGWLLLQRESLMLAARESHQRLAGYYLEHDEFEAAGDHARRQLALDPWHEEAHRQLMRALDGLGRRVDALAQYAACRAILREELGLEPEAATRLLYQQIKDGRKAEGLPDEASVPERLPLRLPRRLLPLIGRERELRALRQDIADPARRLISITGPGGVGKTSLALEAAWRAAGEFNDGAAFVPLENLQPGGGSVLPEMLAATIGAALDINFADRDPLQTQLQRHIRDRELLLVMDNFEHLLAGDDSTPAAFVTDLLQSAPGVTLLVTSREHFGIPAEAVHDLAGLPVPDMPADQAQAEMAQTASSVRLFVEQARRNQRDFRLTADNSTAVITICRLVDGLPLGIELAARWVSHLDCAEIAAAIQENIDFLAAETRQTTDRHQSIRATFRYSWQMLSPGEQQMLSGLAIMPGRFSRSAALAISAGSLGELVRLQGKSLLRQEQPAVYSLHPLLRQYATGKLAEQPADYRAALQRRFSTHYLRELARQGEGFNQAWTGEAIKAVAANIDNIRGAWQLALDRADGELLTEALQPLYHYYRIQGLFREARQIFRQAAAALQALHEQNAGSLWAELLGRALLRQGRLAWFLGDTDEATSLLQESLGRLRSAGARRDLSRAYAYLGEARLRAGQRAEAGALLDQALALYRAEGDNFGMAAALELQAVCASESGHFETADRLFWESITLSRGSGSRRLEGRAYHDWGMLLLRRGRVEQSAGLFSESQQIARELDLRMPIAFNQSMLARTDRHRGAYEEAHRRLVASLQVLEQSGYVFYVVAAQNMLGETAAIMGSTSTARAALEKALSRLRAMDTAGDMTFEYLALDFLLAAAYLFAASGGEQTAAAYLDLVHSRAALAGDLAQRAAALRYQLVAPANDHQAGSGLQDSSLPDILRGFQF